MYGLMLLWTIFSFVGGFWLSWQVVQPHDFWGYFGWLVLGGVFERISNVIGIFILSLFSDEY